MFGVKKPYEKYVGFLKGVNWIFTMPSLCIVAVGIILKVGVHLLEPLLDLFIDKVRQTYTSVGLDEMSLSSFEQAELLQHMSVPVIAVGAYSLMLAVLGITAAKGKFVILLIVYLSFVTVGLLLQGFSLYVLFASRTWIDVRLKPVILNGLHEHYKGYNETNMFSQSLNIVMVTLQCCGVNDYTDFIRATRWRRKLFQDGWWFELRTPLTCCKMGIKDQTDFACAVNPLDSTSNYLKGCYEILWQIFYSYQGFTLAAFGILMIVQFSLLVVSVLLVFDIRKRSKDAFETENQSENCKESKNGLKHSVRNGLLNNLHFTGLSGETNNEPLQQKVSTDDRRYSVLPDLLAQLFLGTRRFNQYPFNEYGLNQGRMPSFDFGLRNDRTQSFDFGITPFDFSRANCHHLPQYDNGYSQGPIIVNVPQAIEPELKAITNIQEIPSKVPESTKDVVKSNENESKVPISRLQKCKSENCIMLKKKTPENNKSMLNRQETFPNRFKSVIIKEEIHQDRDSNLHCNKMDQ